MFKNLKDRLFGTPKDEELGKIAVYLSLPNLLKRKVSVAHTHLKESVLNSFNKEKINKDFTNEELLGEITLTDEFVDKTILHVTKAYLKCE